MILDKAVIQVENEIRLDSFCSSRINNKRIDGRLEEIVKEAKLNRIYKLAVFPENENISRFTLLIGNHTEEKEQTNIHLKSGEIVVLKNDDKVGHIKIISKQNRIYKFAEPANSI